MYKFEVEKDQQQSTILKSCHGILYSIKAAVKSSSEPLAFNPLTFINFKIVPLKRL